MFNEFLPKSYHSWPFTWIKYPAPMYVHFNHSAAILKAICALKGELMEYISDALAILGYLTRDEDKLNWILSLLTKRYGLIYFISRYECNYIEKLQLDYDEIESLEQRINTHNLCIRCINYAVYSFIHKKIEEGIAAPSPYRVPPFSFWTCSKGQIVLNIDDFTTHDESFFLHHEAPLFDLHDFSHWICTQLDEDLYGCKNFKHFTRLPEDLQYLIRSSNFTDIHRKEYFTDNFVFRQLSLGIFNDLWEKKSNHEIEAEIAERIFLYYKGEAELYHPVSNTYVKPDRPLQVNQLLTLIQNKCYELVASEMEEQLFIRGADDSNNPLLNCSLKDFVRIVNCSDTLFYQEARNYVRHRGVSNGLLRYLDYLKKGNDRSHKEKMVTAEGFLTYDPEAITRAPDLYSIAN